MAGNLPKKSSKTVTKVYRLESLGLDHKYSLEELCQRLRLESEFVLACLDHGIAQAEPVDRPVAGRTQDWPELLLSGQEILKLKKAARLHRDLGLDYSALGLVLDLLDDVESLRSRVRELNRKLERWETDR